MRIIFKEKQLRRVYLSLYSAADSIVREHNPCDVRDGRCLENRRLGTDKNFCCGEYVSCPACKHLGPKGCTTKSLACKLWLCSTALQTIPASAHLALFSIQSTMEAIFGDHTNTFRADWNDYINNWRD